MVSGFKKLHQDSEDSNTCKVEVVDDAEDLLELQQ